MTEAVAPENNKNAQRPPDEIHPIELLVILMRSWKLILGLPLMLAVVAGGASFAMTRSYKANARLVPPQQTQSGAAALLSQLGGVAAAAAAGAGQKGPGDVYVSMLKSRTVADGIIARHQLAHVYGTNSLEKARSTLADRSAIGMGKDGLISIEVMDRDPRRAALLANAYIDELTKLTQQLAVSEAGSRARFFERQLDGARVNLARAERTLADNLGKGGVVSVDADSRVMVETMARLRAAASAKEIELGSLRAFVTENNPQFHRVRQELASVRRELASLESGRPGTAPSGSGGLENIKVLRDLKYYQMLYELLAKQYQAARIEEARAVAPVPVLDPAFEPEHPSSPRHAVIVGGVFGLGLLAAIGLAFAREARARDRTNPVREAKWAQLRAHLGLR